MIYYEGIPRLANHSDKNTRVLLIRTKSPLSCSIVSTYINKIINLKTRIMIETYMLLRKCCKIRGDREKCTEQNALTEETHRDVISTAW